MSRYISFRDFDWLLFIFVLMICGLGVMEIHSATLHTKFAGAHVRQVYWIAGGVVGMFLVSLINYQKLLDRVHWFYIAAIVSLMSVMLFGQKYLGARRWIKMPGGGHFQPSEWVKLILILAVAKYFADLHQRELSWPDFAKAGAIVIVPMLMVLRQPDLGTSLTYLPIAVMGLFLGGVRFKQAAIVTLGAALLLPLAWHTLKPYQRDRLTSFMHPEADSQGFGLPGKPVPDCSWIRRGVGEFGGFPDAFGLSASPTNGLHIRRLRGGAWICGCAGCIAAILYSADEVDPERANGARPRWHVRRDGCGGGT